LGFLSLPNVLWTSIAAPITLYEISSSISLRLCVFAFQKSRKDNAQDIELQLKGFILNMMTNIGMPAGYMI
jgi:hypothetical protein